MLSTPLLRFSYGRLSRILHRTWWKVSGEQLHQKEQATMSRSVSAKSASLVSLIYTRWVYRRGLALQRGILEQTPFVVAPQCCSVQLLSVVRCGRDCGARAVQTSEQKGGHWRDVTQQWFALIYCTGRQHSCGVSPPYICK